MLPLFRERSFNMGAKISFVSLGCDKNLIDSEIMLGLIDECGYIITDNFAEADIIIVNSCGFIMDANREAIDKILEVADNKETGACNGIIVTGCMAQRYKNEIFESLVPGRSACSVGHTGRTETNKAGHRLQPHTS